MIDKTEGKPKSDDLINISSQFIASETHSSISPVKDKISKPVEDETKILGKNKADDTSESDSSDAKTQISADISVKGLMKIVNKDNYEIPLPDSFDLKEEIPAYTSPKHALKPSKEDQAAANVTKELTKQSVLDSANLKTKIHSKKSLEGVTKITEVKADIDNSDLKPADQSLNTEISTKEYTQDVSLDSAQSYAPESLTETVKDKISHDLPLPFEVVSDVVLETTIVDKNILKPIHVSKTENKIEIIEKENKLSDFIPENKIATKTEIIVDETEDKSVMDRTNDQAVCEVTDSFTIVPEQTSNAVTKNMKEGFQSVHLLEEKLLPKGMSESKQEVSTVKGEASLSKKVNDVNEFIKKEIESIKIGKQKEGIPECVIGPSETVIDDVSKQTNDVANVVEKCINEVDDSLNKISEQLLTISEEKSLLDEPTSLKETQIHAAKKNTESVAELKEKSPQLIFDDQKHVQTDEKLIESDKKTMKQSDQLTDILIDMLIDQETNRSPTSLEVIPEPLHKESPGKNLAADEYLEEVKEPNGTVTAKCQVKTQEKISSGFIHTPKDSKKVKIHSKESVTIPKEKSDKSETTGDKVFSYVTTPTMQRRKIGGSQRLSREERPALMEISYFHDESSDDSGEEIYIVTEPPEKNKPVEQHQRKVQFRVESEEDPTGLAGDEQEEEVEFEELKDDCTKVTKHIKVSKHEDGGLEKTIEEYTEERVSEFPDKDERKIRRVERHFERMASETLEADPVANVVAEGEFQRMVSQLSTEEVNECLQVWDEGGLTPSSELDSKDATEGDIEDEYEQLPQGI